MAKIFPIVIEEEIEEIDDGEVGIWDYLIDVSDDVSSPVFDLAIRLEDWSTSGKTLKSFAGKTIRITIEEVI